MDTNKEIYVAPEVEVVALRPEGIVCGSQTDYFYGRLDEND